MNLFILIGLILVVVVVVLVVVVEYTTTTICNQKHNKNNNNKYTCLPRFCLLVVKAYMLYNLYESFYSHCFIVVVLFVIVVHV